MKNLLNLLKGKKTYITAVIMFIAGGANAAGLIDDETYKTIVTVLLPLGLGFLRSAINEKK